MTLGTVSDGAPAMPQVAPSRSWQLLTLSARTPSELDAAAAGLAAHLEQQPAADLADVARTLHLAPSASRHRLAVVCSTVAEAVEALRGQHPERVAAGAAAPEPPPVVFMFPGQGAEHVNMALGLYREERAFREPFEECVERLKPLLGRDLREVIFPPAGQEDAATQELHRPVFSQPALFAVSYALAQLWRAWGVRPDAVLGYSTGELVAACVAGVFSLQDALAVIAARGWLIERVPPGAMLAAAMPEHKLRPHLGPGLCLAAVGGPSHCVAAGPPERVEALEGELRRQRVACRKLVVTRAYHSDMLDPILAEFGAAVARVRRSPPSLRFASAATGSWAAEELTEPAYWVRQLREPVRFSDALALLGGGENRIHLEAGPGQPLTDMLRRHPPLATRVVALATCRHPKDPQPDLRLLLATLGRMWLLGTPVDWPAFHARG